MNWIDVTRAKHAVHGQMKRRGLTPEGQTLEGLVSNAEKSQQEFEKMEADKVVVSGQAQR